MKASYKRKKKRTICLEGLPGGGKTSLTDLFKKNKHYSVVNEIIAKIPEKPNQEFFLKNDKLKAIKAKKLPMDTIVDRGFASSLAYDYARYKIEDNYEIFETSLKYYNDAKSNNLLPDIILYLTLGVNCSLRRKNRKASENIWTNASYLYIIKEFYDSHMPKYFPNTKIIHIPSEEMNIKEIYDFITQKII